jgi:hypothetical protein
MEFPRRQRKKRTHATVGVDAENLDIGATVWFAIAAGDAFAAVHVRLDRATVAGFQAVRIIARFDHLDSEFVTKHAWVAEEGLTAGKGMQIGTANTDPVDTHQGVARLAHWLSGVDGVKFPRLFKNDL